MKTSMTATTTKAKMLQHDKDYKKLESLIAKKTSQITEPLFVTNADLWDSYLSGIGFFQQYYNCNCCRRFIQRYLNLVTIEPVTGDIVSPFLDAFKNLDLFKKSYTKMMRILNKSAIVGRFLTKDSQLGNAITGEWTHLHGTITSTCNISIESDKIMAEKLEEFKMLSHGLIDYKIDLVIQAIRMLESDTLYRAEKAIAIAKWFLELHQKIAAHKNNKNNIIWLAVANAPPGFAHIRTTIINTLLDDLKEGIFDYEDIQRRWAAKMHPLRYQRSEAPPKEGTINRAEKLVDKMGLAPSFERRFATLDDVKSFVWRPTKIQNTKNDGMFNHLRQKQSSKTLDLPAVNITWVKFLRDVIKTANMIEVNLPTIGSYYGLITAVDPDAPNLMQWDNPVNWYFYHNQSNVNRWNLSSGWTETSGVFYSPHMWTDENRHQNHKKQVFFAIPLAEDKSSNGLSLFPEVLKHDLREIRSVIEAHSKSGTIISLSDAVNSASGIAFLGDHKLHLRITNSSGRSEFILDRWE